MKKYQVLLTQEFLYPYEYQERKTISQDEVSNAQEQAYDLISKFEEVTTIGEFQDNEGIEIGYISELKFEINTHLNINELKNQLELLRQKIDYAKSIEIEKEMKF